MKSKSFDLKRNSSDKLKPNKTFDFSKYYTSAAETKTVLEQNGISPENHVKETKSPNKKLSIPSKRDHSPKKKKNKLEPLDISHIDIEGPSLGVTRARNTPLNESKLTSTPRPSAKDTTPKVKSIMKNKSATDSDEHFDTSQYSPNKSKKRNKSVSFMLDDTEELVVKKTKSNDSIDRKQDSKKQDSGELKKNKSHKKDDKGKENKRNDNVKTESEVMDKGKKSVKTGKDDKSNIVTNFPKQPTNKEKKENKKEKLKKVKKQNGEERMDEEATKDESNNNEDQGDNKMRRAKKKKHSPKQNTETEGEGEPAAKSQKKEVKPEAIVENLESLSIGDNAHTLTNLLDEMTVAEKDKRKKHKNKLKKAKKQLASPSDTGEQTETEEVKEKVKWQKRKWNKDKKGDVNAEGKSTVIVDNLPLSMVCSYKKQLAEHFKKHGEVKGIGVAETYPTEDSKPVFTTAVQFYSEEAAKEALKEDNTSAFGGRIRVRPQPPATETTLVLRSYADLTDQSVSSAFAAAGKVRSIRHLVKGKKSIATAFVEFDGPDALQKALKLSENARIAGKKVHVSRFEVRRKHKPAPTAAKDTDSEDSD